MAYYIYDYNWSIRRKQERLTKYEDYQIQLIANTFNLKYLKNTELFTKELLKGERNKIKMSIQRITDRKKQAETKIKTMKRTNKKNDKHYIIQCKVCDRWFQNKKALAKHNEDAKNRYWTCQSSYKVSPEKEIMYIKKGLEEFESDIHQENEFSKLVIKSLSLIIKSIIERRRALNITCICCKKTCSETDLRTSPCNDSHRICSNCFDDIEEKCPVCHSEVQMEKCYICLTNCLELSKTGCPNGHSCCATCLEGIKNTNPSCPFCRAPI